MLATQESVFGTGRGPSLASSMAELASGGSEFWIAEVGGQVVCGGRLTPVAGTEFAGIWGGSTLPESAAAGSTARSSRPAPRRRWSAGSGSSTPTAPRCRARSSSAPACGP